MTQISGTTVTRAAAEARDHPALSWTARLGFACYGLVYLLIGWLAAQLALGDSKGSPSRSGALAQVAQEPFGRVVLWVAVGGFCALVVWEMCQLIVGHRDRDGMKKIVGKAGSAAKAAVFATLAVLILALAARTVRRKSEPPVWAAPDLRGSDTAGVL